MGKNAVAVLTQSTVGQKVVMATTGLIMVGWLALHMFGNLLVFVGKHEFDAYAEWIQSGFGASPEFLWLMRVFMLAAIALHIRAAVALTARNRAARPNRYAGGHQLRRTTYAARFMLLGGLVLLAFLAFHLAHLTLGVLHEPLHGQAFVRGQAYDNLMVGLGNPVVAAFYIVANLALGAHLWHGVTSGLQTLGVNHPRYDGLKAAAGIAVPGLIVGGNILIALGVLLGVAAA